MAITYNAGTKTIAVPDGSEGTPKVLEEILDADVLGGWNVFTRPHGTSYYESIAKIEISGWLSTQEETLAFIDHANFSHDDNVLLVNGAGAGLTVGVKTARGAGYSATKGSSILWQAGGAVKSVRLAVYQGDLKLYGLSLRGFTQVAARRFTLYLTGANSAIDALGCDFDWVDEHASMGGGSFEECLIRDPSGTQALRLRNSALAFTNCNVYHPSYGIYLFADGVTLRGVNFYGSNCIRLQVGDTATLVDCNLYASGREFTIVPVNGVITDKKSWQPVCRLGSKTGPVIQDVNVLLIDGKDVEKYKTPGYGGTDAKTDASGNLDFLTAGIGPVADTADLIWRTATGTLETLDDTYKDHVAYCKKDGLIELIHPLPMDRTRKNDIVVLQPKSAMSYPAGIGVGETGRINVVKEPSAIKVVI